MSSTNAGSIYYDVEMDVKGLLSAQQQVNARLDSMERGFNSTSKAVEGTERSFSSLTKISVALSAAMSVKQITEYATAWVDVNNKLANAVKTNESLAEVTSRVFDIAQSTKSDLQSTAALYGTLERSTRSLGLSSNDLSSVIKTVNEGLVLSGATTQEAAGATLQLSQALASGALRGDEFNSVSENGSRLAQALADSLGVNIGQLKVMAGQGKLTSDVVINGLLSQGATIAQEFNNHTTTLAQSLQIAGNNLTKFFGENTTVNTFLTAAGSGIVTLSENISSLASVLTFAAVAMGGRFVASLTMAAAAQGARIKATIQGIAATRQQAQQDAAAASVAARKAAADTDAALSALNLAKAEFNVAKGTAAEAFALENLIRIRAAYVATSSEGALANNALAASQARVAATGVTLASSMRMLSVITGPLGGPVGIIASVAAGWFLYSQRQAEARQEAIAFSDTLPDVIKRLKDLNLAQSEGVRADTITSIQAQKSEISDLKESIAGLENQYRTYTELAGNDKSSSYAIDAANAANELAKKRRDLDGANARLQQSEDALHLINIQVNQGIVDQMKAARDNANALSEAEKKASFLGATQAFLAEKFGISTAAIQKFNTESLKINWGGSAGDKLIKQAERKLELSKLQGDAQARLQAQYDAEDAGVSDPLAVKKLQEVYAATVNVTQAKANQKKEDRSSAAESKRSAAQAESVTQKLDQLRQQSDLNAVSSQNLTLEQTKLRAEMSLGKNATAAQRAEAAKYAEAIWQQAAALKARNLIPEVAENDDYQSKTAQLELLKGQKDAQGNLIISQQQYQQESERLAANHISNLSKINSQNVVTPQQSLAGQVDPVQQLANENAQKLALIQQFTQQRVLTEQQGIALMNAANTQYDQQRTAAQWALLANQSTVNGALTAGFDSVANSAGSALSGILTGTESVSDAMQGLVRGALSAVINSFVQAGAEWVKNIIIQQTMGSAASALSITEGAAVASAWAPAAALASLATLGANAAPASAGIASTVGLSQGFALAGMRKNGGPVQGGSMYQVGESGLPEIYKASNGSQYMIPGDNGSVLSNKDITGGASSGITVTHVVNNYASGVNVQNQTTQNGNQVIIETLLTDMENGGPVSSSMQSTFGLSRKATGDY
ncbi:tape measure protein [Rosenbergiella nectarea]|uniref:tape measure protein n=2 Tax=Rosenbergiella nectarea TaxID=988801 RepID=UPI001F4D43B5|nr:tape measure protein [Rosenbergiella nectarea]